MTTITPPPPSWPELKRWSRRTRPRETKKARRWWFSGGHHFELTPEFLAPRGVVPFWVDPDPAPAGSSAEKKGKTKGSPTSSGGVSSSCTRVGVLRGKAKRIVKLLEVDQSLKAVYPLPLKITCGSLRNSLRSMYSSELTLVQELSIKTSASAESQPCDYCKNLQVASLVEKFKKGRYENQDVSMEHLSAFEKAFAQNVPDSWNARSWAHPYVPNGAGTRTWSRSDGGNWNEEGFSDSCRIVPVFTKGKWRTVTAYSGHNVEVLTPLHHALYERLKRRNWLLVGSPTGERLRYLQSGCSGNRWLSFDYIGATDNIKTAYVQRAVEILIDKGEGLTSEEVRCLRVVAQLRLGEEVATRGQPMGSPMSFPLLCLINKTIVDMALTELLIKGEISTKEWSSHRCLINGDDLLTRSTSRGCLAKAVWKHGAQVGMESNPEKTLDDPEIGEINSTCFKNCVLQKKTNVSALWMAREVTDVLGFADEASVTTSGFRRIVRNNASRLARQKIKTFGNLPWSKKESLLSSSVLRKALTCQPSSEPPKDTNLFPVVTRPDGYDLSRREEVAATLERVRVIRDRDLFKPLPAERRKNANIRKGIEVKCEERSRRRGLLRLLKPKKPADENNTLLIFASAWEKKRKEELLAADPWEETHSYPSDLSGIDRMVDQIKTFKDKRNGSQAHTTSVSSGERSEFVMNSDYVSLTDDD
nr:MAG: putative RNA-dependent RNA polymerase [Botourmiaviridae sp.]